MGPAVYYLRLIFATVTAFPGPLVAALLLAPAVPFVVVAILTRSLSRFLERRAVTWQELLEFAPTVGWRPKPNLNTYARADKVFQLTTDTEGWRGQRSIGESEVIVFGDSFAFGYGVDDKAFFANIKSKVRIKAIGANGYNMVQALQWMERLSSQLKGKLVVWFIFVGNDLYDNLQPNL